MKSTFRFDFTKHDYGPATASIHQLMSEWSEIEWPAPPRSSWSSAHKRFSEHHRLIRSHAPKALAERVDIVPATGGWAEFAALCQKVRSESSFDWRYGPLKTAAHAHSEAHGWTREEELRQLRALPDLGNLMWVAGSGICWVVQWDWPRFEELAGEHAERASFYYGYCGTDLIYGMEWQLAEPGARLDQNPFCLLLSLYAAGYYPFSMGPDSVVLFSFAQPQ